MNPRSLLIFLIVMMSVFSSREILLDSDFNTRILAYICLLLVCFLCLSSWRGKSVGRDEMVMFLLCSTGFTVLAIFQSMTASDTVFAVVYSIILVFVAIFGYRFVTRPSDLLVVGLSLAIGMVASLLLAFDRVLAQISHFGVSTNRLRVYGDFTHPNFVGGTSTLSIVFLGVYLMVEKREQRHTKLAGLAIIVLGAIVIFTNSRTSYYTVLAFFGVICVFYLYRHANVAQRPLLLFGVVSLGMVFVMYTFRQYILAEETFAIRMSVLSFLAPSSFRSYIGFGFLPSSELVNVVSTLGDVNMELLVASLYFKGGYAGIGLFVVMLSYLTICGNRKSDIQRAVFNIALLTLIVQSWGEAFLASIVATPSLFAWVLLSTLALGNLKSQSENQVKQG